MQNFTFLYLYLVGFAGYVESKFIELKFEKTKVYIDVFYYGAALSGIKTYIEELVSGLYKYGSNDIDYIFSHDIKSQRKKRFFINSKYKFFRWIFQFLYFFWKQVILPSKLFLIKLIFLFAQIT